MASIVQIEDFTTEITIAQVSQPAVEELLQEFIDEREPEFLKLLLGPDLYDSFIDGLGIDDVNEDDQDAPDDIDPKWTALKTQIGKSIAQYVYWFYMDNNASQTSGIGETKNSSDNAVTASPAYKMCKAWNKMVDTCLSVYDFIVANPDDYGEYYISGLYAYGWLNPYCNNCKPPQIFIKVNPYGF